MPAHLLPDLLGFDSPLEDNSVCTVAGEPFEICFSYAASYVTPLFEQRAVA